MHRFAAALILAACWAGSSAAFAQSRSGAIAVEHNRQTFVSTVRVTAADGRVAWGDVFRGMSRAYGYDDRALGGALPNWSVRLNGRTARLMVAGFNRTMGPCVRARISHPQSPRGEPQLVVDIDRQAILASQRHLKKQLRHTLLPKEYNGRPYGIVLSGEVDDVREHKHLVVFIHGLNSHPHTVRRLSAIAEQHGLAAAAFHYPNDQAIEESGRLLSAELKRWKMQHPQQRVSLVAHSMGGLVARSALEDPRLDPGNVDRLIMVATPNQGCMLSQFAFGLDIWEYLDTGNHHENTCLFYSSIEDGLSEATVDLQPGSIFLAKLNRRPRNANVKYSIFLGTGGPCSREELENVRKYLHGAGRLSPLAKFLGSKVDRSIADLDEVVQGYGDGAVAVKRGRLEGVEDINVMGFGHLSILHDTDHPEVRKVYSEVLKRLLEK